MMEDQVFFNYASRCLQLVVGVEHDRVFSQDDKLVSYPF